jgi:hypothetical protein
MRGSRERKRFSHSGPGVAARIARRRGPNGPDGRAGGIPARRDEAHRFPRGPRAMVFAVGLAAVNRGIDRPRQNQSGQGY